MANVIDLLEQEWLRLRSDRASARSLEDVCRLAGDARSLEDVEQFVRRADPSGADEILLALVSHAVGGGPDGGLAARVLLQLLLPGTRSLARRWWALGDHDERAAAAVAAVYHRICCYPLARRPGRIAANVLMDAARDLRLAVPRFAVAPTREPTIQRATLEPDPHPALELAELLIGAVEDKVIDHDDAQLIARSRIGGDRVADIAAHRGSRPRTLWDRRQRAEQSLVSSLRPDRAVAV